MAQKRLGAHTLNFNARTSSLAKGESVIDTLKTFEALGTEIAVIRHMDDHFIRDLKDKLSFSVVNAGAGKFEHPSQSILDMFTILEEFGKFDGLSVAICGDVNSSRVAKSNIDAFGKLGVRVMLCGPEELLPKKRDLPSHCELAGIERALAGCDVAMFLRIQRERHQTFELSVDNYNQAFGLNAARLAKMKKSAVVMHPGPVNRGVEIADDLVECPQSRIFKQMENGVYARMAILDWLVEK